MYAFQSAIVFRQFLNIEKVADTQKHLFVWEKRFVERRQARDNSLRFYQFFKHQMATNSFIRTNG